MARSSLSAINRLMKIIAIIGILLIFTKEMLSISCGKEKCNRACKEKGYLNYKYIPENNYGIMSERCLCFIERDIIKGKIISKGYRVF